MMQKSVYVKLAVDGKLIRTLITRLAENKPPEGLVQCLQVTERQYTNIVNITGNTIDREELESTEGLVVI